MAKTTIVYKDIAVGSVEAGTVNASGGTAESDNTRILPGADTGRVLTLEDNNWIFDGEGYRCYAETEFAFWSNALSDANCVISPAPVITVAFSKQFSSMGVTLTFDALPGSWCSDINVKWYQGGTLKADADFTPSATMYFCEKRVESFDKIVLTLKKTAFPYRRAKLSQLLIGVVRTFEADEFRSASITNEMDETAIELPVSTFNWTLDSKKSVEYLFQLRQPVEVYNSGSLLGVYYIDDSSRTSGRMYKISCKDALGVLSDTAFAGGAYLSGISAKTLLVQLAAPFAVEFSEGLADATLKGVLSAGTMREAIQQVLFAWGVCLATDGGDTLRVFPLPSSPAEIPKDRTFADTSVKTDSVVTEVQVTAHTYTENASGGVEIGGVKYEDMQKVYSVQNPDVTASDRANVKKITNATLVSPDIGQQTAERVYARYAKRDTISARIVYSGEKLGDRVKIFTPWDTQLEGNVRKMEIKLSNTVVIKTEAH